ncbi:MAG TPA: 50S ribosomal protein L32 [Candidatus Cloacimonadota bacterium]|nr:50S ribosomal protein L32 [Candidatus Cloacimonadota bacterium]HPT71139.1 50S ribosomal protein L32 [Candidatus Cloacimonadota bacterium]
MAVPKRRQSKTRGAKRRTNDRIATPKWVTCSKCGEAVLSHQLCTKCGTYNGKQVIEVKA